jgi:hypothetical protein
MRIAVLGPLEVTSDTGSPVAVPGAEEFLEAPRARADAELRAAQQRALAEARGRRRLR